MGWTWRLEAEDGSELPETAAKGAATMANQSDAESWLGEHWRELAESGVARVTLLEDGQTVYGPMSLSAD
jgi:hypothetical protein